MSNTTAKAKLAEHQAELAERRSLAAVNIQRRADLQAAISRMTAEQEIDGIDHTQRLVKARQDLAEADAWLQTWPDVEQELCRRITAAELAAKAEEQQQRLHDMAALLEAEAALRIEFAAKHVQFAEIGYQLRNLLHTKEALIQASFEAGHPIRERAGTTEMSAWSQGIGTEGAVNFAKEELLRLTGNFAR